MNSSSDLTQEINQLHAEICSALADPRRILMLYKLADQPWNVGDLAKEVGISQRGLVSATRKGASVEYQLIDERLIQALDLLRAVLYGRLTHRATLIEETT